MTFFRWCECFHRCDPPAEATDWISVLLKCIPKTQSVFWEPGRLESSVLSPSSLSVPLFSPGILIANTFRTHNTQQRISRTMMEITLCPVPASLITMISSFTKQSCVIIGFHGHRTSLGAKCYVTWGCYLTEWDSVMSQTQCCLTELLLNRMATLTAEGIAKLADFGTAFDLSTLTHTTKEATREKSQINSSSRHSAGPRHF